MGGGSRGYASLKWIVSKLGYPMVSPMELLEKIAPTPTQSGGDESRAATLALRLIVALEGIAACSLYRSWPGGSMPRAAVVRLRNGTMGGRRHRWCAGLLGR